MKIKVKRVAYGIDLPLPEYQTPLSVGADLVAAFPNTHQYIPSGGQKTIPTGIAIELPAGYEAQVRGRSGMASSDRILAHVGTIDADYRGEIAVILANNGTRPFKINKGDRIAQLVISPVVQAEFVETEELADSERGDNGFGSTGR